MKSEVALRRATWPWVARAVVPGLLLALVVQCSPSPETESLAAPLRSGVGAQLVAAPRVIDLCVGDKHTCALTEEGRVACWGLNDRHQIDDSDTPQFDAPTSVDRLLSIQQIECGWETTCARSKEGEVSCWGGAGRSGRLKMMERAKDLLVDAWGGCVVTDEGKVVCWVSQDLERTLVVEGIEGARTFVKGVAGEKVCATRGEKAPICFGPWFMHAPTRVAEYDPDPPRTRRMTLVERPEMIGATDLLMLKGERLCGVFANGEVRCDGALPSPFGKERLRGFTSARQDRGCGTTTVGRAVCGVEAIPSQIERAFISDSHACGLTADGRVRCWGLASFGQLGDGTRYFGGAPRKVPNLEDAVSLGVAANLACVARRSGKITCWGRMKDEDPANDPFDVPSPEPALEVSLNASSRGRLCARGETGWRCLFEDWVRVPSTARPLARPPSDHLLMDDGRTARWTQGSDQTEPDFFAQAGLRMRHLAGDGNCGVDDRGRLVCGQCGACRDPRAELTVFDDEAFTEAVTLISDENGQTEVCGLTARGSMACYAAAAVPWSRALEPRRLTVAGQDGPPAIHVVGHGGRYEENLVCALYADGNVGCMGSDRFLQRGGHGGGPRAMTRIEGLPAVQEIGTGGSFVCARTVAGEVYCWGSNRLGTAPDGTPLSRPAGVAVRLP